MVAGSWLVVLDGCCALRASPSGSTQRGTAPRPLAPTFPATLRRHRRRPFAVNVRIPLDLQFPIACLQKPSSISFQLRVKLEANVGKFRIRLQASVPRLRDPTGAYRLLLGSVLESIMIGDSVFRRQPTSALNLRLGRKYTF